MLWLQLRLDAARDEVAQVTERLEHLGAHSVSYALASGSPLLEPAPGAVPLWDRCRVTALFPVTADVAALRAAARAAGWRGIHVDLLDDAGWLDSWRQHAVSHRFGDRLWVLPKDAPAPAAGVAVRLDPGLAFGTGGHPTTRLCLEWLARTDLTGRRVLDYGCGSGILALAACALGAERVVAVDHDPQALLATRQNAAYNHVSEARLTVCAPEELHGADPQDVLVANILANALRALAPVLTALLRPGGTLVLSGVLDHQAGSLIAAYPEIGFAAPVAHEGWVRLVGRRISGEVHG